jgi:hypothetical protein
MAGVLLDDFGEDTGILLGSEERGAGEAAMAAEEDFFCVTLVQSLMVRGSTFLAGQTVAVANRLRAKTNDPFAMAGVLGTAKPCVYVWSYCRDVPTLW